MKKSENLLKPDNMKKMQKVQNWEKLKKLIMLTFFGCCVTIILVGCENGNIDVNSAVSKGSEIKYSSGQNIDFFARKRFWRGIKF